MADNFNENQLNLITSTTSDITFVEQQGDYIQVTVLNQNGDVINLDGDLPAIFQSNISSIDGLLLQYQDGLPGRFTIDENGDVTTSTFITHTPEVKIFRDSDNQLYVKPNQILNNYNFLTGNYQLRFNFLKNWFNGDITPNTETYTEYSNLDNNPRFFIQQISPSRKEIRLLGRQGTNDNLVIDESFISNFELILGKSGDAENPYNYDYVIKLNNGTTIPITNYVFDGNGGVDTSLILRLQTPIPTTSNILDNISIEQILVDSQEQDIYFVSSAVPEGGTGGLSIDTDSFSNLINSDTTDSLQSYNELVLTSSITNEQLSLISSSVDNQYQNLNIDFKHFSNHVFFGSAKSKLENFKTKVSKIEDHLVEISHSLRISQSMNSGSDTDEVFSSTHISDRRKVLFNKIVDIKNNFTPYERFLYYDNQSNANTSSAPGLGDNLARTIPVSKTITSGSSVIDFTTLNNFDGFNTVYKHSGSNENISIFSGSYYVQYAPFFNDSGSFYLSFIAKASGSENYNLTSSNTNLIHEPLLPSDAYGGSTIQSSTIQSESYKRFIFEASQSYFEPTNGTITQEDTFTAGSSEFRILTDEDITGSGAFTEGGLYATFPQNFNPDIESTGSVLPMGELFNITFGTAGPISSSYITDVRISKENPLNALPFSQIYSTGSTQWINWYDGLVSSASYYDDNNIHSLTNNLPRVLREDVESTELKTFVNMWGEHFDLLRNYVDNYASFYKRRYKKSESIPTNLLPILAENLGWELINPFTGSLSEYFTSKTHGDNYQDITDNTWRKILNNLIYIYKSKGTSNAIQALLNTYGYPSDVLTISEFGGSNEESNPSIITNEVKTLREGLGGTSDNVAFIEEKAEFISMNMRGDNEISTDWYMDNTTPDTLEFVFATSNTTNNQTLVQNSGSSGETMWDIRLLSGSTLQFRLNTSLTGSLAIGSNNVSLTTPSITSSFATKDLFNVILQRETSSLNSAITQSYKLGLALQDGDKIQEFNVVSASVTSSIANSNFIGSGSRHPLSSSNLIFGKTLTGSIGEIRAWTGSISMSKFKQHTLNKFSVIGNTGVSSSRELIYRFRLNENYSSGTLGNIFDANPNHNGDYTIPSSSLTLTNNGDLYNKRIITVVKLGLRTGGENQQNDNKIVINPDRQMIGDLHPLRQSFKSNLDIDGLNKRKTSNKLELVRSINKKVNDYIINILSDVDISDYFSDPRDLYKDNYNDLNNFRDDILEGVQVDVNKFIEAQSTVFNTAVIGNLSSIIPAHSNLNNIGVQIDQNLLERTKIQHREMTISTGSDAGLFDLNLGRLEEKSFDFSNSSFDKEITFNNLKVINQIVFNKSQFESDKEGLINFNNVILLNDSEHVKINNMDLNIANDNISFLGTELLPIFEETLIDINNYITDGGTFEKEKVAEVNMVNQYSFTNSEFTKVHDLNITKPISFDTNILFNENNFDYNILYSNMFDVTSTFDENNFNSNINYDTIYNLTSTFNEDNFEANISHDTIHKLTSTFNENNFDYTLNQVTDLSDSELVQDLTAETDNKTIIGNNKDLLLSWGTGSNDTHFLNFQSTLPVNRRNKGVLSDYNVDYYENRFNFITIGGQTIFSSSKNSAGNSFIDFEDHKFVLNAKTHTDGRPIGATHKISASGGVITYPENHFRNLGSSKLSIRNVFYVGSKNGVTVQDENNNSIYSSKVQFDHGLDVQPTSSFYTINVGGADTDTILRVEKPGGRTKT